MNLASNDLKRCEDALAFSTYLFIGPFETIFVLVALSLYLGITPAIVGTSCFLLIVPVQVCIFDVTGILRVLCSLFSRSIYESAVRRRLM